MEQKKFNFSQESLKKLKQKFLILKIILPFFILALIIFNPSVKAEPATQLALTFLFTVALTEGMLFFTLKTVIKKLAESNLILSDKDLEISMYTTRKSATYANITRVTVRKTKSGQILFIIIKTPYQKIKIFGLETMEMILAELTARLIMPEIIKEKISIDMNNPANFLILFIAGMAVYLLLPKILSLFLWGFWGVIIAEIIFFIMAISMAWYLYKDAGDKIKKWIVLGVIFIGFNAVSFLIRANKIKTADNVFFAKNDFVFSASDETYKILIPKSYTYINYASDQNILFVMNKELNKRIEDSFTIMNLGTTHNGIDYDATVKSLYGKTTTIKSSSEKINGCHAYNAESKDNNYKGKIVLCAADNRAYLIEFLALSDVYQKYLPDYDRVIKSLSFN